MNSIVKCFQSSKRVLVRRLSAPVKVVAEDVPRVVRRAANKAVKEAVENEETKVTKSTFRQRINPFLWGFVLMTIGGVYLVNRDLQRSNAQLQNAVNAMKVDKEQELKSLEERVDLLERRHSP